MSRKGLTVVAAGSRRGERALAKLAARGDKVLDRRTVAGTRKLVREVRRHGDPALLDAARRLDGARAASAAGLRLPVPDAESERAKLPPGLARALERAVEAVERYHRRQADAAGDFRLETGGVTLEERRLPLARIGVYVPGGRASYPSTAVMTVVPARVAGVSEIAVATPPGSFAANPALRYALARLGVEEVWGMGGAHAVAALAYGTESVRRVDKIVGPGNAWVTAAKREVAGDVGIDGLAGPTELVVVAAPGPGEGGLDPGRLAADLLAQAEHDPAAAAVLVTTDRALAKRVAAEVDSQLDGLATAETARESIARFGWALVVGSAEEALPLVEALAPEHLQLVGAAAEALAQRVRSAGAVFLGEHTPEVFGDYVAGPSHVLPTGGSARFASGLSVEDFLRRSHTVRFSPEAAGEWAAAAAALADAEGLPAHAASARRRLP